MSGGGRAINKLIDAAGKPSPTKRWDVARIVSAIGKAAGVVVDESRKGDETIRKFASAHDLRRAFGFRWEMRVMRAVPKDLMRHEDIGTTMKYYVGQDADAIWATEGNTLGNTRNGVDSTRETTTVK